MVLQQSIRNKFKNEYADTRPALLIRTIPNEISTSGKETSEKLHTIKFTGRFKQFLVKGFISDISSQCGDFNTSILAFDLFLCVQECSFPPTCDDNFTGTRLGEFQCNGLAYTLAAPSDKNA